MFYWHIAPFTADHNRDLALVVKAVSRYAERDLEGHAMTYEGLPLLAKENDVFGVGRRNAIYGIGFAVVQPNT